MLINAIWLPVTKVLVNIKLSDIKVTSESRVKRLGINIDNRLNFDYNVSYFCKKASKKLHVLTWIFKYVETSKRKVLVNSFLKSQLSYCAIIWVFYSRRMEHRINKIHERALHLIYPSDSKLTFKELLDKKKNCEHPPKNLTSTSHWIIPSKTKYFTKNIKIKIFY